MIKKPLTIDEYRNVRDAGNEALFCTYSGLSVSLDEINAEIVTAVNAYEANQALIKQLVEALDNFVIYDETHDEKQAYAALEAARKAGF